MSNKEKKPVIADKDYPLSHVPQEARAGLLAVAGVLLGFTFFTPTMAAGAQLGAAFKFTDLMMILLAGSLILGLYVATICAIGAKTGLTSVLLCKYTLGSVGSKWSSLLLGGTQVLWYAINADYMGRLFAGGLGLPNTEIFFVIFWALVMGASAMYGFRMMAIISYLAMPLMVVLIVVVMFLGVNEVGSMEALFGQLPNTEMTAITAITIIVGTFVSGGTQAANWARFAKTAKVAFAAGLIGFLIGNGIMVFTGMIGGFAFQTGDIIELMFTMGLTVLALIILTLNIWTSNNATAYAFGVAGAEMFNKNTKQPFIIGGLIIATIVAVAGIGSYFIPMLYFFGTFIPPLGGIIIGDFYFTFNRTIPMLEYVKFKKVRISPIIAYVLGCAVAYFGGVLGIGVPPLQGIIVAALAVPVLNAILKAAKINDMHEIDENAKYV